MFATLITGVLVLRSYTSRVRFGSGTGAILFDVMHCDGTETSLRAPSCLWRYSNPEYCSHGSDVGVICDSIGGSSECYTTVTSSSTINASSFAQFACFSCCFPIVSACESIVGHLPVQKSGKLSPPRAAFTLMQCMTNSLCSHFPLLHEYCV